MARFAEGHQCRMLALVQHFGDLEDSGEPCGKCDVCAPQACIGAQVAAPGADELTLLSQVLERVRAQPGQAVGRLCRELLGEEPSARHRFERLLGGLVRGGQVKVLADSFEKDGKRIDFQRLQPGPRAHEGVGAVRLPSVAPLPKVRGGGGGSKKAKPSRRRGAARTPAVELPSTGASAALVASLRAWRLTEAQKKRVPAFRILTNRALVAIAQARPQSAQALRGVPGVGPKVVQTYSAQLITLCARA
jgi:DNA topoisomerase-3